MGSKGYKDLIVWQRAKDLVEDVYRVTESRPTREAYSLTNQVRRSVVSIPANIAEGQGRSSAREFAHHVAIANGSLYETETHMLIAQRLRYLDKQTCDSLISQSAEVARLLNGLMRSLATS
ncbi:MAG: four helix bundle protein [Thermomicrobiales bacterium]